MCAKKSNSLKFDVVIDGGGSSLRISVYEANSSVFVDSVLMPNCIYKTKSVKTRVFLGDQLSEIKDRSQLYMLLPYHKGYLINWDAQRQLLEHAFKSLGLSGKPDAKYNTSECRLIFAEPMFNFASLQKLCLEMLFGHFKFAHVGLIPSPSLFVFTNERLNSILSSPPAFIVVDSGFSFTHVIPYCRTKILLDHARRLDIGGKIITNYLKDAISYRQINLLDETYVVNQMKEDCCFVSLDFDQDLDTTREASLKVSKKTPSPHPYFIEYILPNFTDHTRGYVVEDSSTASKQSSDQCVRLSVERFTAPELLFSPSIVGIKQMGLSELVAHLIGELPPDLAPIFAHNIYLTGGTCKLANIEERLERDVKQRLPVGFEPRVVNCSRTSTSGESSIQKLIIPDDKAISSKKDYNELGLPKTLQTFKTAISLSISDQNLIEN